jgi:hypothetical protein
LEPAVRAYLVCAVGTLVSGSLLAVTWLKVIGGVLLGFALVAVIIASLYLFAVGRIKSPSKGPTSPTAAGETLERE